MSVVAGRRAFLLLALGQVLALPPALAAPPRPGAMDLCPVCGMLVAKYPNWLAIAVYRDGHAHFFDGAKDLFKYLGDLAKYAPGHRSSDITELWVTEFYGLTRIDARQALYVVGSDVLGPMGHEFVALDGRSDADDFLREHHGRRILSFAQVSADLAIKLDQGRFD